MSSNPLAGAHVAPAPPVTGPDGKHLPTGQPRSNAYDVAPDGGYVRVGYYDDAGAFVAQVQDATYSGVFTRGIPGGLAVTAGHQLVVYDADGNMTMPGSTAAPLGMDQDPLTWRPTATQPADLKKDGFRFFEDKYNKKWLVYRAGKGFEIDPDQTTGPLYDYATKTPGYNPANNKWQVGVNANGDAIYGDSPSLAPEPSTSAQGVLAQIVTLAVGALKASA